MSKRNPWVYVPTLYFAQGLPYTIVMMMSAVYFKDLGASNTLIGLTGALQLPWTLKFAWAPFIDFCGKKKRWVVVAQLVLSAAIGMLALTTITNFSANADISKTISLIAGRAISISIDPVNSGIFALAIIAIASATHDASIDGYYLEALNKSEQALFVGVRNTAFRLSMIFGSGGMVFLAGTLTSTIGKNHAWLVSFAILAGVMLLLFTVHNWYLPDSSTRLAEAESESLKSASSSGTTSSVGSSNSVERSNIVEGSIVDGSNFEESSSKVDASSTVGDSSPADHSSTANYSKPTAGNSLPSSSEYSRAILTYFQQPKALAIVLYILLFRLGDAMVMRMITPFLQDPATKGGMGLSVAQVGTVYGTVGVCFLLLGGISGGYLVSKQGLKRWFWPATLVMNSTILLYWLLATIHPSSIVWVYVVNSLEQFGYGFGMAAYTVFLLSTVKPEFKAAHYAVASALMALGLMGPNIASGFVYEKVGYANFFLLSFFLTIPGIISIFFLPIWQRQETTTG